MVKINEVFNDPYKYTWKRRGTGPESNSTAVFKTDSGDSVEVMFTPTRLMVKDSYDWEIMFMRNDDDSLKATGTGDEFRIMGTVINIIRDWWNGLDVKPHRVEFSATKEGGVGEPAVKNFTHVLQR